MPDIDRAALNRALAEQLEAADRADLAYEPWTTCPECKQDDIRQPTDCPRCGAEMVRTPRAFCTDLNAAVTALNALGLEWYKVGARTVGVFPRSRIANAMEDACDAAPASLATALVQAALRVLGEEEKDDLGR